MSTNKPVIQKVLPPLEIHRVPVGDHLSAVTRFRA